MEGFMLINLMMIEEKSLDTGKGEQIFQVRSIIPQITGGTRRGFDREVCAEGVSWTREVRDVKSVRPGEVRGLSDS